MVAAGWSATHLAKEQLEVEAGGERLVIEAGAEVDVVSTSGSQAFIKVTTPGGKTTITPVPADRLEKKPAPAPAPPEPTPTTPPPAEPKEPQTTPPRTGATEKLEIQGQPVGRGQRNALKVPYPEDFRKLRQKVKAADAETLEIVLFLPLNFDPAGSWPVITAYITDNAPQPDTAAVGAFSFAIREGWVALGASGPAKAKSPQERAVDILAALHVLETTWPAVKTWRFATGGFSGGAAAAGYVAAALLGDGRDLIGIYMSGINFPTPVRAEDAMKDVRKCSSRDLKRVPVFLSNGVSDPLAGPAEQKKMADLLDREGFKNVRAVQFDGAHVQHQPHAAAALAWFLEERQKR